MLNESLFFKEKQCKTQQSLSIRQKLIVYRPRSVRDLSVKLNRWTKRYSIKSGEKKKKNLFDRKEKRRGGLRVGREKKNREGKPKDADIFLFFFSVSLSWVSYRNPLSKSSSSFLGEQFFSKSFDKKSIVLAIFFVFFFFSFSTDLSICFPLWNVFHIRVAVWKWVYKRLAAELIETWTLRTRWICFQILLLLFAWWG